MAAQLIMGRAIHQGYERVQPGLLRGFGFVRDLLAPAYGPAGGAVLYARGHGAPRALRAGAAIADAAGGAVWPGAGARMLAEAMFSIDRDMGNGASTLALLAHAFARATQPVIAAGLPVDAAAAQLTGFADTVARRLSDLAVTPDAGMLDALVRNATGGDDGLFRRITKARSHLGPGAELVVAQAEAPRDGLDIAEGFHVAGGFCDPRLAPAPGVEQGVARPSVLILRGVLLDLSPIAPVLNRFMESGRNLVIVADALGDGALAALLANRAHPKATITAIKGPGQGQWRMALLEDLAVFTGGRVIAAETGGGLEHLAPADLGQAAHMTIARGFALVQDGAGDPGQIAIRKAHIRHEVEAQKYLAYDRQEHRKRLARFDGGLGWLRIAKGHGFADRRRAAQAAVSALPLAVATGVLPTGAAALLHGAPMPGARITTGEAGLAARLETALQAPLICLLARQADPGAILAGLRQDAGTGYDVLAASPSPIGASYPAGVMARAVRDAASVVATALTVAGLHCRNLDKNRKCYDSSE